MTDSGQQQENQALPTSTEVGRKSGRRDKVLAVALGGVALLAFLVLLSQRVSFFTFGREPESTTEGMSNQGITLASGSVEKFNFLSQHQTSNCSLQPNVVLTYTDDMHLQGSCCFPMDLDSYQKQVEGLKRYADIAQIPSDPYDLPASLAKELLGYQTGIQLTSVQQAIYDQAMPFSKEGGPCCCHCWRWYAFEGMAKYLITQRGWNAQQVADLWDLVQGCGGPSDSNA